MTQRYRALLSAKDLIDRAYAEPLDVTAIADHACCSCAHFSREFKRVFGESPHRYLMTRRIERAKALLRHSERTVTEVCMAVGFTSLGSFSSRFHELVGESPSAYRDRWRDSALRAAAARIPGCVIRAHTRPARFEKP